jgi:hypothetical protein
MRRVLPHAAKLAIAAAVTGLLVCVTTGRAQELEPRSYSASPAGLNFLVAVLARSTGDVVTDPSLPFSNVEAHVNGFALGYGRTFALFGRQALVTAALPYAWGDASGDIGEERRKVTRSGLADLKAKLSVNLYGNPAVSKEEFASRPARGVLIGASFGFAAPTGQYDPTRLVNLGTNRWAFKPELGVAVPWKRLDFEAYAGVVFFTRNPRFYPGGTSTRTQDPLGTVQGHVSYTFRPGLWLAADATWYGGGAAHVNGGPGTARLNNTRVGGTISVPLGRTQSLKFAYSTGASVRTGQDFDAFSLAWQIRWF